MNHEMLHTRVALCLDFCLKRVGIWLSWKADKLYFFISDPILSMNLGEGVAIVHIAVAIGIPAMPKVEYGDYTRF